MNIFKKILFPFLIISFIFISFIGCKTAKWYEEGIDGTMKNELVAIFTQQQIDSICIADTLPINLKEWIPLLNRDYEEGDKIQQYIFVKRYVNGETVYIISQVNDSNNYRIQKRSVK